MSQTSRTPIPLNELRAIFGERLQENVRLSNYTTCRVGGTADSLLIIHSSQELEDVVRRLWAMDVPFYIVGSGSNVLVSDAGLRGTVLINRAHTVKIDVHTTPPSVWAESGANLSGISRQLALRGLSGLEWACTVPGTVGGAIYGNAGAFSGNMHGNLILAEILHRSLGRQTWTADQMEYTYRSSILKRQPGQAVVLTARLSLSVSSPAEVQATMDAYTERRRSTQPPGASLGSMFKNPEGDYAGRLIEAAGLKGTRVGGAEVSSVHANFFVNNEQAQANDIYRLIRQVQKTVFDKFGTQLELEIELLGEFEG